MLTRIRQNFFHLVIFLLGTFLVGFVYFSMIRYAQFETGPCGSRPWNKPQSVFWKRFFLGKEVEDLANFSVNQYTSEEVSIIDGSTTMVVLVKVYKISGGPDNPHLELVMDRSKNGCEVWVNKTGIDFRPAPKQYVSPSEIL